MTSSRPEFPNGRRLSADHSPPLFALNSKISTPTINEGTECSMGWLFALYCQAQANDIQG
jgi:hypothetical protein